MIRILKELKKYNDSSDGIEHRERQIINYFILCSVIAAVSNAIFFPVELLSPKFDKLFSAYFLRFFSAFLLMVNLFIGLKIVKRKFKILICIGFSIELVYMILFSILYNGFDSVYWVGFIMIIVFWFGQPFSWNFLLLGVAIMFITYNLTVILFSENQYIPKILECNFFIFGTSVLGLINSFLSNSASMNLYKKEHELKIEQNKANSLLLNILPCQIADRLKSGETTISEYFDKVSILFADIVGFTKFCSEKPSNEIVEILNKIFYAFDKKTEELGLEKIKTIGDGYMVMGGGLSKDNENLLKTIDLGEYMINFIKDFSEKNQLLFSIRVGIHIGSVTAGVIGKTKFSFDIWGDTVNIASRMESTGVPMEIHITEEVANYLTDKNRCEYRGEVEVKGKGKMNTYIINRKNKEG